MSSVEGNRGVSGVRMLPLFCVVLVIPIQVVTAIPFD